MKKISLLKVGLLSTLGIFSAHVSMAQAPLKENIAGNIGGTRFVITSPSGVAGVKKINYATWGAAASPTISNMPIEKAYDTLGATTLLNGTGSYPSLAGKFALVFRGGGINFSDKAARCVAAGAVGVIIVNNVPGDPVGMAATPTGFTVAVPVLMISDVDGMAISNAIKTAPSDTVRLTLGTWNTGGTHDLGVLANYQATPHAMNIPMHQLAGSAGTIPYKHYIGGAVANYGTQPEATITVTDSVFWIPTSGSASYVTSNSYNIASLSVADSIKFGFGTGTYELTPPSTTGKYEHRYSTNYPNTDDFPQDNMATVTQNVTDSIFCKGNYDFENARPRYSLSIRPGGGPTTFMMGNMFYVKNGGYAARKLQFALTHDTDPTLVSAVSVNANLYKWTDGVGGDLDSIVQSGELVGKGTSAQIFSSADSSGKTLTLSILDFDSPGSTTPVIVEDNSWYFIAIEVPTPLFVAVDESASFFTRSYAQWKNNGAVPGKFIYETPAGLAVSDFGTFFSDVANIAAPFPFGGNGIRIDSTFYDRFNEITSIALLMSKDKPTSSIASVKKSIGSVGIYPNPATQGTVTVDVSLAQKSNTVVYRLTDVIGRTLYSEVHKNVQQEKFSLSTASLSSGNYYLMVITENGIENKKITIQN